MRRSCNLASAGSDDLKVAHAPSRVQWKLIGKEPLELRNLPVNRAVHNTCTRYDGLPDEIKELIVKHVVDFHEDEDTVYYNVLQAKLLANVSDAFWGLTHQLPRVRYETSSANHIDIYAETQRIDADGDPVDVVHGMWSSALRFVPTERRSVRKLDGKAPSLLDVSLQIGIKSFTNNQVLPTEDGDCNIEEVEHTFEAPTKLFRFSPSNLGRTVTKGCPIRYQGTVKRIYAPLGEAEVDEEGDVVIDDEQPRRLLKNQKSTSEELKTMHAPFQVTIDRNHESSAMVRIVARQRLMNAATGRTTKPFDFTFMDGAVLKVMREAIDPTELQAKLGPTFRAARKRALESFSKVREVESERNIATMMREHDEESFERTEEKRRNTSSGSLVGSSSSATSFERRFLEYVAARERRLKAEYDQLMGQLGTGVDEDMTISQLKVVEGRLGEIHAIRYM